MSCLQPMIKAKLRNLRVIDLKFTEASQLIAQYMSYSFFPAITVNFLGTKKLIALKSNQA
ncbi:hypothetical protein ANA_C12763 [Anabaena sp. 90]|nr:hypothetical protein ANA_C12763 [Anabaena sp. 90]